MTKREVNYPHTISFRLTDEVWLRVAQQIEDIELTAHEWCRLAVLEKLNRDHGLSKGERFLFEQFARGQFLVTQGFQLLADDNLTSKEWLRYRRAADERTSEIVDAALAMHAKRNGQSR
jgi:hypothetical protein